MESRSLENAARIAALIKQREEVAKKYHDELDGLDQTIRQLKLTLGTLPEKDRLGSLKKALEQTEQARVATIKVNEEKLAEIANALSPGRAQSSPELDSVSPKSGSRNSTPQRPQTEAPGSPKSPKSPKSKEDKGSNEAPVSPKTSILAKFRLSSLTKLSGSRSSSPSETPPPSPLTPPSPLRSPGTPTLSSPTFNNPSSENAHERSTFKPHN